MTASTIEEALSKQPFAPFDLRLDDGRTLRVQHPECFLLAPDRRLAVVALGECFHFLEVERISSLSFD